MLEVGPSEGTEKVYSECITRRSWHSFSDFLALVWQVQQCYCSNVCWKLCDRVYGGKVEVRVKIWMNEMKIIGVLAQSALEFRPTSSTATAKAVVKVTSCVQLQSLQIPTLKAVQNSTQCTLTLLKKEYDTVIIRPRTPTRPSMIACIAAYTLFSCFKGCPFFNE